MASTGVWSDFDTIRHSVKNNTVDRLKQILSGLNEECGSHLTKTGKKQEVIERIISALESFRDRNLEAHWLKAKTIIAQVRNSGIYTPSRITANPVVLPPPTTHNPMNNIIKSIPYSSPLPGSSTVPRYDPYAPPRKPSGPVASSSASSMTKPTGIRFKESPFFNVDQAVSSLVECPESASASDRRQQTVTFTLTNDHLTKLKTSSTKYQLRLFCTSSQFYHGPHSFRTNTVPCPVEFPPTCEVRVNNVQVTANLKGLKKKPGTAPPPDIGQYCRLTAIPNKIEMVYVNSQQPVPSKKYYLVVMLVETNSVDWLVSNLKSQRCKSSQQIRHSMIASMSEDDDIVAGPQKMSLKCPLSYMRVNTPCRSSLCVHSQCFDATSWFSIMEQTTTWLCPVCERVLDSKDLIIDGYFDEILKQTPEDVEDVIVEADGEWHTSDNKYASATWKASHPVAVPAPKPVSHPTNRSPSKPDVNGKAKAKQEVYVLDSDDEDESQIKRELSPSMGSNSQPYEHGTVVPNQNVVIDLTADTDDEEPPPPRQTGKRKAPEHEPSSKSPSEQVWKKGRMEAPAASGQGRDYHPTPPTNSHNTTPIPHPRYPYPDPHPPNYAPPYTLPGIDALYPGTTRWS